MEILLGYLLIRIVVIYMFCERVKFGRTMESPEKFGPMSDTETLFCK